MEEKYKLLLEKFTGKDDLRLWMKTPFNCENRTMCTDAQILVSVPQIEGYAEPPGNKTKNVLNILSGAKEGHPVAYQTKNIRAILDKWEVVKTYKKEECDACDGEGEVVYEFKYYGKTYMHEDECPICFGVRYTGTGEEDGTRLKHGTVKLHNSVFTINKIADLLFILETLESETFEIRNIVSNKPSYITIENVVVLLMPTFSYNSDPYKAEVAL